DTEPAVAPAVPVELRDHPGVVEASPGHPGVRAVRPVRPDRAAERRPVPNTPAAAGAADGCLPRLRPAVPRPATNAARMAGVDGAARRQRRGRVPAGS